MTRGHRKPTGAGNRTERDQPATLKDLLRPDIVDKLNSQAKLLKEAEKKEREEERKRAEEARKAEQKRLENDFGHLLNNSSADWRKFKS